MQYNCSVSYTDHYYLYQCKYFQRITLWSFSTSQYFICFSNIFLCCALSLFPSAYSQFYFSYRLHIPTTCNPLSTFNVEIIFLPIIPPFSKKAHFSLIFIFFHIYGRYGGKDSCHYQFLDTENDAVLRIKFHCISCYIFLFHHLRIFSA